MAVRLGPVAAGDGDLGQGAAHLGRVGILFDQAQVLAVGIPDIALRQKRVGKGQARLLVEAVILEDVPELDHRAVGVALGKQFHP
jgi:hypothetical protein